MLLRLKDREGRKLGRGQVQETIRRLNFWDGKNRWDEQARAWENPKTPQGRLSMLIDTLIGFDQAHEHFFSNPHRSTGLQDGTEDSQAVVEELEAHRGLQNMLSFYPVRQTLSFDLRTGEVRRNLVPYSDDDLFTTEEVEAVFAAVDLSVWGILAKLPRCSVCQHFYLPSRGGQQTCSTDCSRKMDAKKPERKEQRKRYQRKYYAENFARQ